MAFLKFNKAEIVNLSYSLKREIISANKSGVICNTTIASCNTRRYHGLFSVPVDAFGGDMFMLLSSIDESLVIGGKQFNLGIHKYGEIYEPRGHKYIVDFNADPMPEIVYKVGNIIFSKSFLLSPDKEQLMVRYELIQAPAEVGLIIKPFLAFRRLHELTSQNDVANLGYEKAKGGVSFKMYEGLPALYLQFSASRPEFNHMPCWYNGITYSDEARRGFPCTEDLMVPGTFNLKMKEGDAIVLSASTKEVQPTKLHDTFAAVLSKAEEIKDFTGQLKHCADTLICERGGKKQITAGFSWLYTGLLRETLYALAGLTVFSDSKKTDVYEEILDNLIKDNQERLYHRTTQIEAPLLLPMCLQQFLDVKKTMGKKVWTKYGKVVMDIIRSYTPGQRKEVSMQPNGLLWAESRGVALTWMNTYINGWPVNERAGYQVETNALWYNAICFAIEMESKYGDKKSKFVQEWTPVRDLVLQNFEPTFTDDRYPFLADYVDNAGKHMEVRPNQLYALAVSYSPVSEERYAGIMRIVDNELYTSRGIRTLSPRDAKYKGVYEGTQEERDLAYHNGCAWPFLLLPYIVVKNKMDDSFAPKVARILEVFKEDMNKHGVGAVAELYDGDPPHEPHGAISSALSTSTLIAMDTFTKMVGGKRK